MSKMETLLNLLGIGPKQADPEKMSFPVVRVLVLFSVALGVTLLASNLAALKIWNLGGIPVDAGILLFPLTYIVGDLLVEIFGQKVANLVSVYCSLFAIIIVAILWLARIVLPDFPGVDNGAFDIVQSNTGRIFLASVAGFLVAQLVNNGLFVKLREHKRTSFLRRAILSSVVARVFDSLVFETLAFLGRASLGDFVTQAAFAYIAGLALEAILSPIAAKIAVKLDKKLRYNNGKNETS